MIVDKNYQVGGAVAVEVKHNPARDSASGASAAVVRECRDLGGGRFAIVVDVEDQAIASAYKNYPHLADIHPIEALPSLRRLYQTCDVWLAEKERWGVRERALLDALSAVGRGIVGAP